MGSLSGFRYRELVRILKKLDSSFIVKRPAATRFGSILKHLDIRPYQIIPATFRKAQCAQFSNRRASTRQIS